MTTKTPAGPPVRLGILLRDGTTPDVYAIISLPGGGQIRVTAEQAAALQKVAGQARRLILTAGQPEILGLPEPAPSPSVDAMITALDAGPDLSDGIDPRTWREVYDGGLVTAADITRAYSHCPDPVHQGPAGPEYCDRSWHDGDCCPGSRKDWAARPADPGPAAPDEGTATAAVIEHAGPCTMAHCPVHHPPADPSGRADGSVHDDRQAGNAPAGAARPFLRIAAGGR